MIADLLRGMAATLALGSAVMCALVAFSGELLFLFPCAASLAVFAYLISDHE